MARITCMERYKETTSFCVLKIIAILYAGGFISTLSCCFLVRFFTGFFWVVYCFTSMACIYKKKSIFLRWLWNNKCPFWVFPPCWIKLSIWNCQINVIASYYKQILLSLFQLELKVFVYEFYRSRSKCFALPIVKLTLGLCLIYISKEKKFVVL